MKPEHTLCINFKKKMALKKRITFSVQAGAPYNSKFTDVTFMVNRVLQDLLFLEFQVNHFTMFDPCPKELADFFSEFFDRVLIPA